MFKFISTTFLSEKVGLHAMPCSETLSSRISTKFVQNKFLN